MGADSEVGPDILVSADSDGVALVTLNRPAQLNAMTASMQADYAAAMLRLDRDPSVRAIVVTGAGRGWCAGADLGALAGLAAGERPAAAEAQVDLGAPLTIDTPVIAAVNGPVAGMGFSYLLMADVRYAAAGARISSTFARLGLVAEWGSAWLLPRIVGLANASEILLSGNTYTAEEMQGFGLIQKVFPAEDLLSAALAWARGVATDCSPRSTAHIKSQLRRAPLQTPVEAFAESVTAMLDSFGWPELTEAVAARLEKRAPEFPPFVSNPLMEGSSS